MREYVWIYFPEKRQLLYLGWKHMQDKNWCLSERLSAWWNYKDSRALHQRQYKLRYKSDKVEESTFLAHYMYFSCDKYDLVDQKVSEPCRKWFVIMRQAIIIFLIFAIPKMKGSWMTEYCEDKRKALEISKMKFLNFWVFIWKFLLKRFEIFLIEQRIIENLG